MDPDPNVTGENAETPSASPAEIRTPEQPVDVNSQGASSQSPEEVAWNELKGNTQERFEKILQERNEERLKAERLDNYIRSQNQTPAYQPQNFTQNAPEVVDAVQRLSSVGIATDAKVDEKINQRIGNLIYNFELEKLENKYNGADGLPKFSKLEYEDYVGRNPQYSSYSPEDIYQKMYSEEILDAKMKSYQGNNGQSTTSSLRPTATAVREDALTPEFIERRLNQPDGRKWYAENLSRINNALASAEPSE